MPAPHGPHRQTTGRVTAAFGNLLHVFCNGEVLQGEIAIIRCQQQELKGEVIEVVGQEAKLQVFEESRGVQLGTPVFFSKRLLEAELGPGLLGCVFDGLHNPLQEVADAVGLFLQAGTYLPSLDRAKHWNYQPTAKVGERLQRADRLGYAMEGHFRHQVMIPFTSTGAVTLRWVIKPGSYTVDTVVARGVDDQGQMVELQMLQRWPVKMPLAIGERRKGSKMMDTGCRIIDTQFPIAKGGTFCAPGPFGAGKTVLQQHLAKYAAVDIVVIVACGERAGEVVEILRTFPQLNDRNSVQPLMSRTVIICNTSSMPVAAREASIYMGTTIAEYYRQMGLDVLLLADSTSRWAQAMREISGRLEEIPGEEAFPAYLGSRIAAFYERAGVLKLRHGEQGSLTIGGTVSPAAGNFEEPVTQATLAVVGAFHGLSRDRSDARRYPAIDPLLSWSKYLDIAALALQPRRRGWKEGVEKALALLQQGDAVAQRMEVVGEEGIALADFTLYLKAELYEFCYLQQNFFDSEDAYCPLEQQLVLFGLMQQIFTTTFRFDTHDEGKRYFLELQSLVKNLSLLPFASPGYQELQQTIMQKIATAAIE